MRPLWVFFSSFFSFSITSEPLGLLSPLNGTRRGVGGRGGAARACPGGGRRGSGR